MKNSLRNFLILLAVLVVGYVVYFIVNLFKPREAFTEKKERFISNTENVAKFFALVTAEDAKKAGLKVEIFELLKSSIYNNEPEKILAKIREYPEALEAINNLILQNRERTLPNNSNTK